jgi:hypothetical protein
MLRERLRGVSGVERVTYGREAPRENSWATAGVRDPESSGEALRAEVNYVGPGYLEVLALSPLAGREFDVHERSRGVASALISHNLAEALWPGQSPLNRTFVIGRTFLDSRDLAGSNVPLEVEVVGVTPDGYFSGFRGERRRFVFLSAVQDAGTPGETTLYIRYSGNLETVGPAVLRGLQQADARVALVYMRTWNKQLAEIIGPIRILTILVTVFALTSLLIASIGQYAVVSFDVRRRVREFGVRMALGASAEQVMTLVVREHSRLTVVGLTIGFALSLAISTALGSLLYGITPTDPLTYAAVFAVLFVVSMSACYVPARRTAHIDPMVSLRCE